MLRQNRQSNFARIYLMLKLNVMIKIIKSLPAILIASTFLFYSCESDDDMEMNEPYIDVIASEVKMNMVDDANISPYEAIFDVSPYYSEGHLPFATSTGSVNGLAEMIDDLDKTKSYLVYCHADAPSMAGAQLLEDAGFMSVYRLEGNYAAWDQVSFEDIMPSVAKSKLDASEFMNIFDVSPYYDQGHLPGAINANASAGGTALSELIADLDKDKTYLVYCHANAPSMAGAQLMEDAGFMNVYRLEGNYSAWVDADYMTEMPTEISYMDVMASDLKMDLVDDANISPYEAIFDVSPYYTDGHLPFATSTGSVGGLEDMLADYDKTKSYLVYCHADGPSISGAELLIENGFTSVYRLEGNYNAWDAVSFEDIMAAKTKSKIDASEFMAIFDVSPHFDEGHLPGATNANPSAGGTALSELIADMDKSKTYLVYCHADAPSMAGAQLMEDAGFTNVYRLEGNYGAWVDAGFMVE